MHHPGLRGSSTVSEGGEAWRRYALVSMFVAALAALPASARTDEELILAGDVLRITVWNQPGLTGLFAVADDGAIVFPLVGRIDASNHTVRWLEQAIISRLADGYVLMPQVRIEIDRRAGRVTVTGEVRRPGRYRIGAGMTVAEALAAAGWLTDRAGTEALVTRTVAGHTSTVATVTWSDVLALSSAGAVPLSDGDVVLVRSAACVYVSGAVARPGEYVIRPGAVIAQAIADAGGVLPDAAGEVTIVRAIGDSRQQLSAAPQTPLQPDDEIVVSAQGPVRLIRQLGLVDAGYDSNIHHTAALRRGDMVATARAGLDLVAHTPRYGLDAHGQLDYLYFHQYAHQRSVNSVARARLDVRLDGLQPFALGAYDRGLARDQFDMNRRLFRTEARGQAGTAMAFGAQTTLSVSAAHARIDFAPEGTTAVHGDHWLDRTVNQLSAGARGAITPVTTASVETMIARAEFPSAPERDADQLAVLPRIVFGEVAAAPGHAAVGYRQVRFDEPVLRPFRGVIANVELRPSLSDRARLIVSAERDFHYSADRLSGYYTLTAAGAGIEQWLGPFWRVELRGGLHWLRYDATPAEPNRTDRGLRAHALLARHLTPTTTLSFDIDFQRRLSVKRSQTFDALTVGMSVIYVR